MAVVVHRPDDPERLLTVRRPPDDPDLPDAWGLPAASLRPGESWEDAVRRTGREKLGVGLGAIRFLRMGETSRPGGLLHMRLYAAEITEGRPRVPQPAEGVTRYVELAWSGPERLVPAARRGSLCSRLCLEVLARPWRSDVDEAEGDAVSGSPADGGRDARPASGADWNVVVTTEEEGFDQAEQALRMLGDVRRTSYYNVLVLRAEEPESLPEDLASLGKMNPRLLEAWISRVTVADETFSFDSAEEFRRKSTEAAQRLVSRLEGRSFHVRMHRRGFREQLDSRREERRLGDHVVRALGGRKEGVTVEFDDPDAVLVVETVDGRAGLAVVSREELQAHPFLAPE